MALRRQLDPHSLYNTLNAIAGSVRSAPATAIHMLSNLGELLRLTLRDDVIESNVADEFSIAVKYLTLYQLRYPDKLSIQVDLDERCRDAALPPLLLQPLVENAALHGVNAGCPSVKVSLQAAEVAAGRVQITISNTSAETTDLVPPADSAGIGLRNTWERLQLSYGSDFSFDWLPGARDVASLRLEIPRAIPKPTSAEAPRAAAQRTPPVLAVRKSYSGPQHQSP
jgi:two-component system sensor histidine kinase AlgZ